MKKKIVIIVLVVVILLVLGILTYMRININSQQKQSLGINENANSEKFIYDGNSNLEYDELKYAVFSKIEMEELNERYPIKCLKEKNGIYYTIYSLKDNKLCYIVFKEAEGKLCIDYSWVYSEDMIEAKAILDIPIGTDYLIVDTIDKNAVHFDNLSSLHVMHFLKDGRTASLIGSNGKIEGVIMSNSIFDVIYDMDRPEKIMK